MSLPLWCGRPAGHRASQPCVLLYDEMGCVYMQLQEQTAKGAAFYVLLRGASLVRGIFYLLERSSKMAQPVKVLAAKPVPPEFNPRAPRGRQQAPRSCLLTFTSIPWHAHTQTHT